MLGVLLQHLDAQVAAVERLHEHHRVAQLQRVMEAINAGKRPVFDPSADPVDVVWLVKTFFNELSVPLLDASLMVPLDALVGDLPYAASIGSELKVFADVLGRLAQAHRSTARAVCTVLHRVANAPEAGASSPSSLGEVFGPVWLRASQGHIISSDIYDMVTALAATLIAVPQLLADSAEARAKALDALSAAELRALPIVEMAMAKADGGHDDVEVAACRARRRRRWSGWWAGCRRWRALSTACRQRLRSVRWGGWPTSCTACSTTRPRCKVTRWRRCG